MPQKFNEGFTIQWLHEGKEIRPFTEDELQSILPFDSRIVEREKLIHELSKKIINPLVSLYNKHLTLQKVLISLEEPSDRLLYSLIEDAAKQNITDFYDLMDKFIGSLRQYKNNYSPLFNRGSQEKLFMAFVQGNPLEYAQKWYELSMLIDQKRNFLFAKFDKNGGISKENWDKRIDDMVAIRNIIKAYRDKVASHADEESVNLSWKDATQAIQSFVSYVSDAKTVLSFHNRFELLSDDMKNDSSQVVKGLRNLLFR